MMDVTQQDILERAQAWRNAGQGVALATVVRTWGSSPRPVGSHLAVDAQGGFVGSVSGGCIESAVIHEARAAIEDGRPRLLEYGVSDEQAWEAGLACGGRVQVYVQRVDAAAALPALLAAQVGRRPAATLTRLADGARCLLQNAATSGDLNLNADQRQEALVRILADRSGPLQCDEGLFLRVYAPAPRMLVIGAVHIARALAPRAALAGFAATIIDPRSAFAAAERFPEQTLCADWPDEALARYQPDLLSAVITLSHDPKLDDPALVAALNSEAFYIGSLGSKRTHAQRLSRLRELGFDAAALARIHAPVGLDLGGRLPIEIAVSILAPVLQVRYRGSARALRALPWLRRKACVWRTASRSPGASCAKAMS